MHHWAKRLIVLAASLLLTGCLWGPGNFTSDLTVLKDGSFTLDYKGEIVLAVPPDEDAAKAWTADMAHCSDDAGKDRVCTASEIASQKSDYEKQAAEKQKQREDMAKAFGLVGFDDESNRVFAAKLVKYAGWRSVVYRGGGVFDVDYHFEGKATQDFIFPALPGDDLIIPFIAIRRRGDGSVLVTAPALTGGAGPLAGAAAGEAAAASGPSGPPPSRAQGRFTVMTDGEILTNNSEDGPSAAPIGRQLHWDVVPASKTVPETLIRLQ